MAWVRVSDDIYEHERFADAGALGIGLFVCGLAYCNRNLTDGVIPRTRARLLCDTEGVPAEEVVERLIELGRWHVQGHDCDRCEQPPAGSVIVHDYLDYQPSAEKIRAERARNAIRQSEWRERHKPSNAARNGVTTTDGDTPSNAGSNGVTNGDVTPAPNPNPNPNPKRSNERETRKRRETRAPTSLELTEANRSWAAEKCPLVDPDEVLDEFLTWARSKDARYTDWTAAWQNAMRRQQKWAAERKAAQPVVDNRPDWMLA